MTKHTHDSEDSNFEITSKRRKGLPSEKLVKRGTRVLHVNIVVSSKPKAAFSTEA